MTKGFGPLLPGFVHLDWNDHDAIKAAITDKTAAIMIEPIQGEGGIRPVPHQCLKGLRDLCDEHGLLLIFDEVQCGVGRSGKLFAHEWAGIDPDIMMVAKGIGGGFPLGAVLASEEAALGMTAGTHGSTYGGNPLGCAVGLKVLEIVGDKSFLDDVADKAAYFKAGLDALMSRHPNTFKSVRGRGLMMGLECAVPNMDFVNAGYNALILTVPAGDNVVRFVPALTITNEEIDEALARLSSAAQSLG
jgi:acetylornithine/N-succinyldiaminopimelate aminotransferase